MTARCWNAGGALLAISNGRSAGDPPSAHPGSEAESMNINQTAPKMSVIGVDVSPARPDVCCLPGGTSIRLSNDRKGHDRLAAPARKLDALVGFETAGGARAARVAEARRGGRPRPPASSRADPELLSRLRAYGQIGQERCEGHRHVHAALPRRGKEAAERSAAGAS